MNEEDHLIEDLEALTRQGRFGSPCVSEYEWVTYQANPPVREPDLALAEKQLGFTLPSLLKRIYTEVGSGGFGPGYGLAPLWTSAGGDVLIEPSLVHTTLLFRDEYWPSTLLYICDWGCNIYTSIDCSLPSYPLVRSYTNGHIGIEAPSLYQWLRDWLNGVPLFERGMKDLPPVPWN